MEREPRRAMLLPILLVLAGCTPASESPGASTVPFAAAAELVFTGTVMVLRSTTIDVEDVADLAVVRVDSVLIGAGPFVGLAGKQVTVRLRSPGDARTGTQRVFFTTSWHLGDDIGVIETGSVDVPAGGGMATLGQEIARVRQEQSDADLKVALASAERVVLGRITAVRRSNVERLATEHDPDWQEADIAIERALKGSGEPRTVTVLWIGTTDPMWRGAPRLAAGQDGIWLMRTFEGARLPHLTVTQPTDAWPRAAEERIRRVLR